MTERLTIMHLADVHLGAGQSIRCSDEKDAERVRSAVERAFAQAIDDAIAERADLVVIPGDLFDGKWSDYRIALRTAQQMARLKNAGIRCAITRGNHDAESRIGDRTPWPDNVKIFRHDRAETWRLDDLGVAVHGQSFREVAVLDNLAAGYPDPVPGFINIGLLHTALDGREGHSNYAPCRVDDLINRGYHYWALGHVHGFERVHENPWIVYPGNLQGRHARETGPKGYVLARFRGEQCELEWRACDVLRWAECSIDVSDLRELGTLYSRVVDAVLAEQGRADGRDLAVRVRLTGSGPVMARAYREPDAVRENIETALVELDLGDARVWLESVRCRPATAAGAQAYAALSDAARVLREFLEAEGEALLPALAQERLAPMLQKLPAELRLKGVSIDDSDWIAAVCSDTQALLDACTADEEGEA